MSEEKGINELQELLDGIKLLSISGARIMANGKIDAGDLSVVIQLLTKAEELKESFTGLKEIPSEVKDLDEAELIQLGSFVFALVKDVRSELSK